MSQTGQFHRPFGGRGAAPYCTTIAEFVSPLELTLFREVLLICARMGLIGCQMFAIDRVKLLGNASKSRRCTRAHSQCEADKWDAVAKVTLARHYGNDALPVEPDLAARKAGQDDP